MRHDFLFELGDYDLNGFAAAWPTFVPAALLGALLGNWCAGFASRYSDLLLSGPWRNRTPVSIRCCSATFMALSAVVFAGRHGVSLVLAGLIAASAILLVLALVDAATLLLPDALTFPLLWLGLACAWMRGPLFLHQSVAGVIAGYAFLWTLFWLYWCVRRREGMGHGDFKLLAALGAWVGPERLSYVLLTACLLGVLFACWHQRRLNMSASYPFGPFLALSGMGVLLADPEVHSYFWR
jgi:leader peptidase (prepilin peptidase)/N-methyltransferase